MKKVIACLGIALAFLSVSTSNAQLLIGGVKGGVNMSNMNGLNDNSESTMGPTGGIFFQYGAKPNVKFNMEFLYSKKGTKFSSTSSDTTTGISKELSYDYDFHYVDIPILVSYNFFNDSAKFRPRVYAGPSFGVRTGAKSTLNYKYSLNDSITSEGVVEDESFAFNYSPVDVAAAVGAGATYAVNSKWVAVLDVRYIMSLTDLSENVTNVNPVKNKTIAIHVGLAYNFGK